MNHMTQIPAHGNYDQVTGHIYDAKIGRWVPATAFYAENGIPTYSEADTKMSRNKQAALVLAAIAALLVAIALTAALSGGSDGTPADSYTSAEQSYLAGIDDLEITHNSGEAGMLRDGYLMCAALRDGYTESEVAEELQANSVNEQGLAGISGTQAVRAVDLLGATICPGA